MIEKFSTKCLDQNMEFIRSVLVYDDFCPYYLSHIVQGSFYNEYTPEDSDLNQQTATFQEYDTEHVLGLLEEAVAFANMLESVNMAHEYRWADGKQDKLQIAALAFIKAAS